MECGLSKRLNYILTKTIFTMQTGDKVVSVVRILLMLRGMGSKCVQSFENQNVQKKSSH